jgi:hypothetical protein
MANLSNKLDRILTKCIQSIEEKGWTIEDCLNQYTTYRDELEPMLRTVMRLRRARRVRPTASFRSNAQSRIRARLQASRRSTILRMADDLSDRKKTTYPPRLQLAGSLIPLLIVSLLIIDFKSIVPSSKSESDLRMTPHNLSVYTFNSLMNGLRRWLTLSGRATRLTSELG